MKQRHKLNRSRIKIRPMRGPVQVAVPDDCTSELLEFIGGMGYLIYEDPTNEQLLIITDKTMTYRNYFKSRFCEGSETWFKETYGDQLTEELPEYRW